MYAHQVIDDLLYQSSAAEKYHRKLVADEIYPLPDYMMTPADAVILKRRVELIRESKKFFLGSAVSALDVLISMLHDSSLFVEFQEFFRLPYKVCWFDFQCPTSGMINVVNRNDDSGESIKIFNEAAGVLAVEHYPGCISFDCFYKIKYEDLRWIMSGRSYLLEIPYSVDVNQKAIDFLGGATPGWVLSRVPGLISNLRFFSALPGLDQDVSKDKRIAGGDGRCLCMINYAMLLLNCKNIIPQVVIPSVKLNKSKRRKGKTEGFTYRVLDLKFPHNQPGGSNLLAGGHNRVHLCHGHFKKYTAEAPLFGRIVGLWWWDPYKRGRNKDGVVEKDYSISVKGGVCDV